MCTKPFLHSLLCTWFVVNLGNLGSTQNVSSLLVSLGKKKSNSLLAISKRLLRPWEDKTEQIHFSVGGSLPPKHRNHCPSLQKRMATTALPNAARSCLSVCFSVEFSPVGSSQMRENTLSSPNQPSTESQFCKCLSKAFLQRCSVVPHREPSSPQ